MLGYMNYIVIILKQLKGILYKHVILPKENGTIAKSLGALAESR